MYRQSPVLRRVTAIAILTFASCAAAGAQDASSAQSQPPATIGAAMARLHPENSVSVGGAAQLTASRVTDSAGQLLTTSVSPSAEIFATFRQSFRPRLGYSVNFGYSRTSDRYAYSPRAGTSGYNSQTDLQVHMFEISLSYVTQQHLTKHLSLFEELGAGTVAFATINTGEDLPSRSNTFLPAAIGGIGIDYGLPHGLGVRTQYRGLLVHQPYPDDGDSPQLKTVISTPALSLTYTFGKHTAY